MTHTPNTNASNTKAQSTKVLYNGDCPVCSFEINHYAAYAREKGLGIRFDDLNCPERAAWGIDEDTAARRLYVEHGGEVLSGVPAFVVLWRQMPRYHWLANAVDRPVVLPFASWLYDRILAPSIYRWHLRRQKRARG
jgi:predicted DCC family thiol-disulfide oxidoreductase YuxK